MNAQYLKQYRLDDQMVTKTNEGANSLIKKAELEVKLKDIEFK
jgi:hypothetical protein